VDLTHCEGGDAVWERALLRLHVDHPLVVEPEVERVSALELGRVLVATGSFLHVAGCFFERVKLDCQSGFRGQHLRQTLGRDALLVLLVRRRRPSGLEGSDDGETVWDPLACLVRLQIKRYVAMVECEECGVLAAVERECVAGASLELEVEHGEFVDASGSVYEGWVFFFLCWFGSFGP